jgi:hypothetical protein
MNRDRSTSFDSTTESAPIADFQILTSTDAFDAIDLARPPEFHCGVIVLLLDDDDRPFLALAIDRAPSHQLVRIAEFLIDARLRADSPRFGGVVFGVIAGESNSGSPAEFADWRETQHLLAAHGIAVIDLVIVRSNQWSTFREVAEFVLPE